MKHYPHHIGDFDKATRHLTRLERSVYRDLIDLYYDTEQRLTLDVQALCRRIIARTNEESTAVQQVLNEFFTETPTGWYHDRCEAEIEAYRANTSQKAMAGKASAEAKRLKKQQALNESSTAVQQPLNPVATDGNGTPTNHKPSTNTSVPKGTGGKPPADAEKSALWADLKTTLVEQKTCVDAKAAGVLLGKAASKYGQDVFLEACRETVREPRVNTHTYLIALCETAAGKRTTLNRPPENKHAGAAAAIFEGATHV